MRFTVEELIILKRIIGQHTTGVGAESIYLKLCEVLSDEIGNVPYKAVKHHPYGDRPMILVEE
jgi:hypothetical protein